MPSPEELAREKIDKLLTECGWILQNQQTLKEFQQFVTPDDGRKFTELYNVQHLQSAQLDRVSRVCISTIQRLYSMLCSFVVWNRNTDAARRAQREETGNVSCAFNEACGMASVTR